MEQVTVLKALSSVITGPAICDVRGHREKHYGQFRCAAVGIRCTFTAWGEEE